jgi:hypothetical protein
MDGRWNFVWSAGDPSRNQLEACPPKLGRLPESAPVELSRESSPPRDLALAAFLFIKIRHPRIRGQAQCAAGYLVYKDHVLAERSRRGGTLSK